MVNRIQLRRGVKSKLPTLSSGEPGYTTDTNELFVGTGSGNVNMGGSHWYTGTAMSASSGSSNYYSSCPLVKLGDMYLNTSNGNVYECTTAGSGSNAKWTYKGCIKGVKGDTSTPITTQSEFETAINSLTTAGGVIYLGAGTFKIPSNKTISNAVIFQGIGESTIINIECVTFNKNVMFRDCTINISGVGSISSLGYRSKTNIYFTAKLSFDNCQIKVSFNSSMAGNSIYCITGSDTDDCLHMHNTELDVNAASGQYECYNVISAKYVDISGGGITLTGNGNSDTNLFYWSGNNTIEGTAKGTKIVAKTKAVTLFYCGDLAFMGCDITTVDCYFSHYFNRVAQGKFIGNTVRLNGNVVIQFAEIVANTFILSSSRTITLGAPVNMQNNFVKGDYGLTVNCNNNKVIIANNMSDGGITINSKTSDSYTSNNLTY